MDQRDRGVFTLNDPGGKVNVRRALWGYKKSHVKKQAELLASQYRSSLEHLETELANINNEIESVKRKIQAMKNGTDDSSVLRERIAGKLIDVYINSKEKVYDAMKEAEELLNEKNARLNELLNEKDKINNYLKNLMEDINYKITESKQKISTNDKK